MVRCWRPKRLMVPRDTTSPFWKPVFSFLGRRAVFNQSWEYIRAWCLLFEPEIMVQHWKGVAPPTRLLQLRLDWKIPPAPYIVSSFMTRFTWVLTFFLILFQVATRGAHGKSEKYWQYSQGDLTWGMYYCTYWVQWLWIFVIHGTRCCAL